MSYAFIERGGQIDDDPYDFVVMAARRSPASGNDPHDGAPILTTEQVSAINRFPDDNANPVMRIDADGHLIYANPASEPIVRTIGASKPLGSVDGRGRRAGS